MNYAYPVNHYHIVFTVPEALHGICRLDSKWFYNHLFAAVWDTLRSFGYSHYGVESGAICVIHTSYSDIGIIPGARTSACILISIASFLRWVTPRKVG